jgi:CBS domain-containing protein
MTLPGTAGDYMSADPITFTLDMDIHRAIKVLLDKRISGAPVLDANGALVGVLSKKDCLKVAFSASYHMEWGGKVSEFMSANVHTVAVDTDIVEVAELFLASRFRRFPVVRDGRLVGVITRHDILKALEELW